MAEEMTTTIGVMNWYVNSRLCGKLVRMSIGSTMGRGDSGH